MENPTFKGLEALRSQGGNGCSYASNVHPKPYYYKYYFWVFWKESPVEGGLFLTDAYRMNIASAMALVKILHEQKEPYMLYNTRIRRRDPVHTPFNLDSPDAADQEWALSYDDDPDPAWHGFK